MKALAGVDRWHFATPSKLVILAMIAVPLIFIGVYVEFLALGSLFSNLASHSTTTVNATQIAAGETEPLVAAGLIDLIGGILALIGFIGGVILGLWRTGSRYDETTIKVGSILLIIPFVDLVSPILFLIGARNATKKVGAYEKPSAGGT